MFSEERIKTGQTELDKLCEAMRRNEHTARQLYRLTESLELERDTVAELKERLSQLVCKSFLLKAKTLKVCSTGRNVQKHRVLVIALALCLSSLVLILSMSGTTMTLSTNLCETRYSPLDLEKVRKGLGF